MAVAVVMVHLRGGVRWRAFVGHVFQLIQHLSPIGKNQNHLR